MARGHQAEAKAMDRPSPALCDDRVIEQLVHAIQATKVREQHGIT